MSYSDGGRSIRKSSTKSPKKLRVIKGDNDNKVSTTAISYHNSRACDSHGPQPSIHKRNLYIVSFPLIFLFNVLRTLLYQLFVVFKYLYTSTSRLISHRSGFGKNTIKTNCHLEIVVGQDTVDKDNLLSINGSTLESEDQMSQMPRRPTGPGPGDPLLAKQKHHHRRAFEFISKALKIDEENEGNDQYFYFPIDYTQFSLFIYLFVPRPQRDGDRIVQKGYR